MKHTFALLMALLALAACGADGPPIPPDPKPATQEEEDTPGITITGEVKAGVSF